ncbi:unnamed protein product [Chironomus riparius]|uniref:Uncharacterized protein n=1 Tax=Chironomus riparius TaxID=315576 RepID=A0A9N9RX08_9DIPT|nr:unnamed protein product [Chironomus riparius]
MWSLKYEDFKIYCITAASLLAFVVLRIFIRGKSYKKYTRCDGNVVVITGGNSGIGKETAIELAARFQKEEKQLDILINNAGVMAIPLCRTEDGLEMQMGVNHMGHFLLTNLLLPMLKTSQPSRIVNVSSMAHRWGKIKTDDLNSEKSYSNVYCYANSKLANILFTRELARRLKDTKVTANALHPGVINTELSRHTGEISFFFSKYFVKPAMYIFNKTPKQGAQTTIYAALDPDLENVSGQYFSECGFEKVYEQGLDDDMAKWLWNISEKWTKLSSKSE